MVCVILKKKSNSSSGSNRFPVSGCEVLTVCHTQYQLSKLSWHTSFYETSEQFWYLITLKQFIYQHGSCVPEKRIWLVNEYSMLNHCTNQLQQMCWLDLLILLWNVSCMKSEDWFEHLQYFVSIFKGSAISSVDRGLALSALLAILNLPSRAINCVFPIPTSAQCMIYKRLWYHYPVYGIVHTIYPLLLTENCSLQWWQRVSYLTVCVVFYDMSDANTTIIKICWVYV